MNFFNVHFKMHLKIRSRADVSKITVAQNEVVNFRQMKGMLNVAKVAVYLVSLLTLTLLLLTI